MFSKQTCFLLVWLYLTCCKGLLYDREEVCPDWENYATGIDCARNPDMYREVPEIIEGHGYPVRVYTLTTLDGYIITLFRIPAKDPNAKIVLVGHGIGLSSIVFTDIGSNSLAFMLADIGMDVWLINFRGCRYSNTHTTLKNTSFAYWNFNWHDIAMYEFPIILEKVYQETREISKINYIGYSMGTTICLAYASTHPKHASKYIEQAILMAPVAFMKNLPAPIVRLAPLWPLAKMYIDNVLQGYLFSRSVEVSRIYSLLCLGSAMHMRGCEMIPQILIFGLNPARINPATLPVTVMQNQDALSSGQLDMYVKNIQSGEFNGPSNQPYPLYRIPFPIHSYVGDLDYLSTEENVNELYTKLNQTLGNTKVGIEGWAHTDFINGQNVGTILYKQIIETNLLN